MPAPPNVSLLGTPDVHAACPVTLATPAKGDPLAKLSAGQVLARASSDAQAESTVCLSTPATFLGTRLIDPATVVIVSLKDGRCEGTVTAPGGGLATVIKVGSDTWVWANQAYARFLAPYLKGQTAETVSARVGKWILSGTLNHATAEVPDSCSIPLAEFAQMAALSTNTDSQGTRVADFTMIDGQRTVGITDPLGEVDYISDTSRPLPARETIPSTPTVTFDYFDFGIAATISAPPASDVVDGSTYGLG